MDTMLYIIIIVTACLVYIIIRSARKEEGYQRWKAGIHSEARSGKPNPRTGFRPGDAKEKKPSRIFSSPKKKSGFRRFRPEAVAWCANLLQIKEEQLQQILKKVPAHYTVFSLRKRSGGFRAICAPDEQLHAVQQTIYRRILISVPVHPAATGFRPGTSVTENARPHLGKKQVLKVDLHDFFPSIRYTRVRALFEETGYPGPIARVLAELCCLKRKLPQGAPTSPALSNIIALSLDRKMTALAQSRGLTYTRYADDLTFSGDDFSKDSLLSSVEQIVEEEGFTLNRKKTRFLTEHKRKIITGVSISSGKKLTIPKAKKREIRKNVHFILTKGLKEHQSRIGSTDPVYLKRLLGYLSYWHSIEPDNRYVTEAMTALERLRPSVGK